MTSLAETFYDQLCQPSSSSHSSEIFPWNRLPRELQVKVLRNLNRRDLSRCRSLSREMFELIRNSESSMRRRHVDLVRIERIGQDRVQLVMRCDEEGKSRKWIACQKRRKRDSAELTTDIKGTMSASSAQNTTSDDGLHEMSMSSANVQSSLLQLHPKAFVDLFPAMALAPLGAIASLNDRSAHKSELLSSSTEIPSAIIERLAEVTKSSEIDRFRINEMELSDGLLSSISSCLRNGDCRVRLLSFELTSLAAVTPAALLRFILEVAPADIVFRMIRGCTQEHFSAELCRFMVSRRFFSVSELVDSESNNVPLSIDDVILAQLTSTTFQIAAPNLITADGLRSFIRDLASGNRQVVAGRIQTNFRVDNFSFSTAAHTKLLIKDQRTIDISTGGPLEFLSSLPTPPTGQKRG